MGYTLQPYQIGKNKYTLEEDTKPLNSIDKKGLYHEFRTILRKHNVSRRENAFDVLVNLFLCKIIDETENKTDLKFRWKGIAYDNYYDLVDRLQGLYQIGMRKFLKEEILYVSNKEIDDAFWTTKTNRNATKKRIKDIFRELKFYKGLDFEFIKVHNGRGFDKNAKILIDIIKMWQSVRLTSQNQNQFLGDMFEFFLDNGIKQTEGQFFTPPLVVEYRLFQPISTTFYIANLQIGVCNNAKIQSLCVYPINPPFTLKTAFFRLF
jgi:type I restriction enzyme M protein